MAIDRISVDRSKTAGNSLVRLADLLAELQGLASKLKNMANHSNDGTNYTTMEALFGLQAGSGTTVVSQLNILDAIINGSTGAGGVTQQGQLSDIVGRISGQ